MDCNRCGLPFTERYPEWKDYGTHGAVDFCLRAHQLELERLNGENERLREACERALTGLYHHALCATQPPNHSAYCDCGVTGTQRLLKLALEGCEVRQEGVKEGRDGGKQCDYT